MKHVGYARVGSDQDLCRIMHDDGQNYAENPAGPGYNWVSSGGRFKPYHGTVYETVQQVPPKIIRDNGQVVAAVNMTTEQEDELWAVLERGA